MIICAAEQARDGDLFDLVHELAGLAAGLRAAASQALEPLSGRWIDKQPTKSMVNLAHYLWLRQRDLRPLQERLAQAGLSSLGRCEPHVLANVNAVLNVLSRCLDLAPAPVDRLPAPAFGEGHQFLKRNGEALFGVNPRGRETRILVTLASDAATNYELVRDLLLGGADCVRINCAHDDAIAWRRMVANVRRAEKETGLTCRILMDLAGPKVRTHVAPPHDDIIHIRAKRNARGETVLPASVLLAKIGIDDLSPHFSATNAKGAFHMAEAFFDDLRPGDILSLRDLRHKKRKFNVVRRMADGVWLAQGDQGAYVAAGTKVRRRSSTHRQARWSEGFGVAEVVRDAAAIEVRMGDGVLLLNADFRDELAIPGLESDVVGALACTFPGVVQQLEIGAQVWIDDGKIGGVVERRCPAGVVVRITRAAPTGAKIRDEKGLNFPGASLRLPALGEKDLKDLDFVCRYADMVGLSFVESIQDVDSLRSELRRRNAPFLPVVIKIETRAAVQNLPNILLGTIGLHPVGVMIARGDMSVELGSVRTAEIQEEILWLCEAAHVPVIWATQVLETIAKKGIRSRPEFTDAAMGVRAECVMLNKGPYVLDAVHSLSAVLAHMQDHQHKKISRLRALRWGHDEPLPEAMSAVRLTSPETSG